MTPNATTIMSNGLARRHSSVGANDATATACQYRPGRSGRSTASVTVSDTIAPTRSQSSHLGGGPGAGRGSCHTD